MAELKLHFIVLVVIFISNIEDTGRDVDVVCGVPANKRTNSHMAVSTSVPLLPRTE